METWKALLEWLEDAEDRATVKAALPKLRQGAQRAGALRWEDVESEWDGSEAE